MTECFLCSGSDKITEFTSESLQKCFYMMLFRKKKGFKYCETNVSNTVDQSKGYHKDCFRKFTALSCRYKQEFQLMVTDLDADAPISIKKTSPDTKGNSAVAVGNASSDYVVTKPLEAASETNETRTQHKTCIFCNQISKKVGTRTQRVSTCNSVDSYNRVIQTAESSNDLSLLEKLKDFKHFPYHSSCKLNYERRNNNKVKKNKKSK